MTSIARAKTLNSTIRGIVRYVDRVDRVIYAEKTLILVLDEHDLKNRNFEALCTVNKTIELDKMYEFVFSEQLQSYVLKY